MTAADMVMTGIALFGLAGIGFMIREAVIQNEVLNATEIKLKETKKHGRKRSSR